MQSKAVQGLGSSGTGAEFSGTGAESGGTGGESGNTWGLIKGSRFGSRGAVVEWRPVEVGAGFGRLLLCHSTVWSLFPSVYSFIQSNLSQGHRAGCRLAFLVSLAKDFSISVRLTLLNKG